MENSNVDIGAQSIITEQTPLIVNETNQQQSPTASLTPIPTLHPIIPQISGNISTDMAASQVNAKLGITPIITQHSPQSRAE